MKKHLFGFALFSFIIAAFAFIFASIYVPTIPQVAEVSEKIEVIRPSVSHEKTSCFRNNSRKKLSSEIVSSHYLADTNKIISEVKLVWNGAGEPPKKVSITVMISGLKNEKSRFDGTLQIFLLPFDTASERTFTIVSSISDEKRSLTRENFYAVASVSDYDSKNEHGETAINLSERKEVVTVHGNSSIIGK